MSRNLATRIELIRDGEVAELRLVPPEGKPPTLDWELMDALEEQVRELQQEAPRLVYVGSNSKRFFCVGANINILKETTVGTIGPWVRRGHAVFNQLADLPCPVVALVRGYAMGGGLELAMACDLIFADDSARLAQSEARLGFIPGWGGCRRLAARVGMARAKQLYFTGDTLDAVTALEWGLVDYVGPPCQLEEHCAAFREKVICGSASAIAGFKRILAEAARPGRTLNEESEAGESVRCLEDADTLRRLHAFLNRKG